MKYGKYTKLVEEQFDFWAAEDFLMPPQNKISLQVIESVDKAYDMAFEPSYDEEVLSWGDIFELEAGKTFKFEYNCGETEKVVNAIKSTREILDNLLERQYEKLELQGAIFSDFWDNIYSDAIYITLQIAYKGKLEGFFYEIFKIYEAGYIPCGWVGKYPEGQIACYKPKFE